MTVTFSNMRLRRLRQVRCLHGTKFKDSTAKFTFKLPAKPIDQKAAIADLLWSIDDTRAKTEGIIEKMQDAKQTIIVIVCLIQKIKS